MDKILVVASQTQAKALMSWLKRQNPRAFFDLVLNDSGNFDLRTPPTTSSVEDREEARVFKVKCESFLAGWNAAGDAARE